MLRDLLDVQFRANPALELVLYDRLDDGVRQSLINFRRDPDFYGVLRPTADADAGLQQSAVCTETALLLLTLKEPMRPPSFLAGRGRGEASEQLARLVLDGILQIDGGDAFVHGAAAHDVLFAEPSDDGDGRGTDALTRLSVAALRHAQGLHLDDVQAVARRLYAYHRRPATPAWLERLPDGAAVRDYLGVESSGSARRRLLRHWRPSGSGRESFWLSWSATGGGRRPSRDSTKMFKIYVGVDVESMPAAFDAALEIFNQHGVQHFKVGADAFGLLRPDKMVAYLDSREQVETVAADLGPALMTCRPHGVPFTAQLDDAGRVSWGADPRTNWTPSWQEGESWRLWLVQQLAVGLHHAQAQQTTQGDEPEPWRFALKRMDLEGVDTTTWAPRDDAFAHFQGDSPQ